MENGIPMTTLNENDTEDVYFDGPMPSRTTLENRTLLNESSRDETSLITPSSPRRVAPQYLVAITATLSILAASISYDVAITVALKAEDDFPFEQIRWLYQTSITCAAVGAIVGGIMGYFVGRKWPIVLSSSLSCLVLLLILSSHSLPCLYIYHTGSGMAFGIAYTVTPIYLSEISDDGHRGSLGPLIPIMILAGTVIKFIIIETTESQVVFIIVCIMLCSLALGTSFFIPETPSFLVWRGNHEKALAILCFLRGEEYKELELDALKETEEQASWFSTSNLKNFLIAAGIIWLFKDVHYFNTMIHTAWTIHEYFYDYVGWTYRISFTAAYLVACLLYICVMVIVYYFKWRILLVVSCVGSAVGYSILVASKLLLKTNIPVLLGGIIAIASSCLAATHLPFIIMSEILPPNKNVIFNSAIMFSYFMSDHLWSIFYSQLDSNYFIFISIISSFVSLVFTVLFVPECKGKSIKDIQLELSRRLLVITFK